MGSEQMSKGRSNTLVAYTCGGQMSNGHAYTLVAYTCGGQMSKGRANTLVAYTCGGQMSKGRTFPLGAYTCSGQLSKVVKHYLLVWMSILTLPDGWQLDFWLSAMMFLDIGPLAYGLTRASRMQNSLSCSTIESVEEICYVMRLWSPG